MLTGYLQQSIWQWQLVKVNATQYRDSAIEVRVLNVPHYPGSVGHGAEMLASRILNQPTKRDRLTPPIIACRCRIACLMDISNSAGGNGGDAGRRPVGFAPSSSPPCPVGCFTSGRYSESKR